MMQDRVKGKVDSVVKERSRVLASKEIFRERADHVQVDINALLAKLCETEEKYRKRKINSPRYVDTLYNKTEELKREVKRMEARRNSLRHQYTTLTRQEEDQAECMFELEKELETHTQNSHTTQTRIAGVDSTIASLNKTIQEKEARIAEAKKIRDMKLSSSSLRRVFFQKISLTVKGMEAKLFTVQSVDP
jgi:chromosome segregation ATPase